VGHKITIIQGHPDPSGERLCHALADAYAAGARAGGHEVKRVEIAALDFPILRTQADFETGAVPSALQPALAAITWADHVVLVFPLWLGTMPALLKAFLEQVARPKQAFAYGEKGLPKKLWGGKSARLIVTMGMPAIVYRVWYLAHGLKGLERSILRFVGIAPVRETLFGMVANASAETRKRWLGRMEQLGRTAR
jgi:putative NADPH-quinone reductase